MYVLHTESFFFLYFGRFVSRKFRLSSKARVQIKQECVLKRAKRVRWDCFPHSAKYARQAVSVDSVERNRTVYFSESSVLYTKTGAVAVAFRHYTTVIIYQVFVNSTHIADEKREAQVLGNGVGGVVGVVHLYT